MIHIINKTLNGIIFKCSRCNKIHIGFKNLNFNFSEQEFKSFASYIKGIDGLYWECVNNETIFERKIRIATGIHTFNILLSNDELEELKALLSTSGVSVKKNVLNDLCLHHHLN